MENQNLYESVLLSSLVKVFGDERPKKDIGTLKLTGLQDEIISFQMAYFYGGMRKSRARLEIDSRVKDRVKVREVKDVPVRTVSIYETDDNYLRKTPGLYPDLLDEIKDGLVPLMPSYWSSLWVDVDLDGLELGDYKITIRLRDLEDGLILAEETMDITVYGASLPDQDLIHTEWFHADCLADYYKVDVFSEDHWEILDNYLAHYASIGCNMVLTPLFTYCLDTGYGLDRTTTQLVDVEVKDGDYIFSYDS